MTWQGISLKKNLTTGNSWKLWHRLVLFFPNAGLKLLWLVVNEGIMDRKDFGLIIFKDSLSTSFCNFEPCILIIRIFSQLESTYYMLWFKIIPFLSKSDIIMLSLPPLTPQNKKLHHYAEITYDLFSRMCIICVGGRLHCSKIFGWLLTIKR